MLNNLSYEDNEVYDTIMNYEDLYDLFMAKKFYRAVSLAKYRAKNSLGSDFDLRRVAYSRIKPLLIVSHDETINYQKENKNV
jgi:hypothetical protein